MLNCSLVDGLSCAKQAGSIVRPVPRCASCFACIQTVACAVPVRLPDADKITVHGSWCMWRFAEALDSCYCSSLLCLRPALRMLG